MQLCVDYSVGWQEVLLACICVILLFLILLFSEKLDNRLCVRERGVGAVGRLHFQCQSPKVRRLQDSSVFVSGQ